ncbi:hypothetical protein OB919_18785 [Halobacteria archaeon AArc-curdl1]|uniref:DNA primase/polymerase bifunctional N-terminal domain-containing protein n=1 Tax=Natronosalvus hydrolyticus TaxID=2979988 RepID=A0AAP3E9C4_9EURY|nr:hypothetical protein [Halobacteria archaeon AArc-curdl1]
MSATTNSASGVAVEPEKTQEIAEGAFTVPPSIKTDERWICFRIEERQDKTAKVPYNPSTPTQMYRCDPTDPEVAVTFDGAMDTVDRSRMVHGDDGLDGVGLQIRDGLVGVDLDDCVEQIDGEYRIDDWAYELIDAIDSFTEISPSSTGIHILVEAELDPSYKNKCDEIGVEIYDSNRFFTFTGRHVSGTPTSIESEVPGLVAAYQHTYLEEMDVPEDTTTHCANSDVQRSGEWGTFPGTVDYDELTDQEQQIVDAGCKYDDDFELLYNDAESAWNHPTKWAGGDKSRCDMSLISKICYWNFEADMIEFELDRTGIERVFMSGAIANRVKTQSRPDYVRYSIEKKLSEY